MKITFVISSLRAGGAERVVATMANHWADRGWPVTILTLNHGNAPRAYELRPEITVRDLDEARWLRVRRTSSTGRTSSGRLAWLAGSGWLPLWMRARWNAILDRLSRLGRTDASCPRAADIRRYVAPRLLRFLREQIIQSRPDCVISFTSNVNLRVLLSLRGDEVPVIVSERKDPHAFRADHDTNKRQLWDILWPEFYPRARAVVVQTKEAGEYFQPALAGRLRVIPNPVTPPPAGGNEVTPLTSRRLAMTLGSLREVKGHAHLVRAFACIADRHPAWCLEIWGEGPLREELKALSQELNVADRVRLAGFAVDPYRELRRADLFVLPSSTEGFPNALCEAMACGLPAVCFDCPGTRAIVRGGVDGLLVPMGDVVALSESMDRLMSEDRTREQFASRAPDVLDRFSLSRVMEMWERLLISPQGPG